MEESKIQEIVRTANEISLDCIRDYAQNKFENFEDNQLKTIKDNVKKNLNALEDFIIADDFPELEQAITLSKSYLNKLNAELACRKYF